MLCRGVQVSSLATQNRYYKKSASFCLRAVARHSPQLAQAVVDCGALESLVACLEEFDPGVKEAAAWALGYVAGHNAELAQKVTCTPSMAPCSPGAPHHILPIIKRRNELAPGLSLPGSRDFSDD